MNSTLTSCSVFAVALVGATLGGIGGSVLAPKLAGAQEQTTPVVAVGSASEPDLEALSEAIEQARLAWGVPGLAVAIVRKDRVLLSRGFGTREFGGNQAVDEDTLFSIASNTKAFTAATLAILVDEGKLRWDDHVSDYLPWFQLNDPFATQDLRIRDLLCHRSGLGTFSGDLLWWGTKYTPRQVLERSAQLKPASPFRSRYGYSNLMFLAAGEVVQAVTGMPWHEYVRSRLFVPLKMERSITSVRDLVSLGNYATPHKTTLDASVPIPWMNWDNVAAAGGIISSVSDMSHWLRLQLRRGALAQSDEDGNETRLFSSKQGWAMWQSHTPIPVSESSRVRFPSTHFRSYGLGWGLSDYLGRKVVGHGGGYDGMYSRVVLVPEEDLGIVVLTNSMTGIAPAITFAILDAFLDEEKSTSLGVESFAGARKGIEEFRKSRQEFQDRIDRAIKPVAQETSPSHPLTDYVGRYRCPLYGDALVELDHGELLLKLEPNPDLNARLVHLHYDTFVIRWTKKHAWFGAGTAHFVANSRGEMHRIELDVPNDDMWFHELNLERVQP